MDEHVKQEIHHETLATVHANSSCDVPYLNNIKEEVLLVEPDSYVDTSEELLFEMETKEDIKPKVFNAASSTLSADSRCVVNEIKTEFLSVEPETYVKCENSEAPRFNFELKLENFDQTFCLKSEDDNDIELESLGKQEAAIKIEMQTGHAATTITQCTENQSSHSTICNSQLITNSTGEKPFQCSMCNYKCSRKSDLQRHMQIHTGEKPFQCSTCSYKCIRSYDLRVHMRIHTGEKPFQCGNCDFKFSDKNSLRRHIQIHTGEKSHPCSMCNYKCSKKSDLQKHVRTHTGEKPFQCDVCDFKFSDKSCLRKHMKIHKGEKPFQCSLCNYKFSRKSVLQHHMKIHTGEKPFQCNMCNYKCSRNYGLQMHLKTHTGEKRFHCSLCNYKFSRKSRLQQHIKIHNGE